MSYISEEYETLQRVLVGYFAKRMPFRLVDDSVQEVFRRCLEAEARNHRQNPDSPQPINFGYVMRAAKSVWIDTWSADRGYQSLDFLRDETGFEPASNVLPASDPEAVMRLLSDREQRVAVLRDIGYSLAEIAIIDGRSLEAIKQTLQRARSRVRRQRAKEAS